MEGNDSQQQQEATKSKYDWYYSIKAYKSEITKALGLLIFLLFFFFFLKTFDPPQFLFNISPKGIVFEFLYIMLILIIAFWLYKKQTLFKTRYSVYQIFISLSIVIFWGFLRFSESPEYFEFTGFSFYPNFFYIDLFIIIPSLLVLFGILNGKIEPKPQDSKKSVILFEDEPITSKIWETYVESISEVLINQNFEHSISVGIIGPWGIGKTSLLETFKKKELVKHRIGERIIWMEFTPWAYFNSKTIVKEFFNELSELLEDFDAGLSNYLEKYQESLTQFLSKNSGINIPSLFPTDSGNLEEQKRKIEDAIGKINKKLVIAIDDLDRLEPTEILQVLKLLRDTASFKNVVYLVPFDKEYVIKALKNQNKYSERDYLQKFFQVEFYIPRIQSKELVDDLAEKLATVKQFIVKKPEEEEVDIKAEVQKISEKVFNTHFRTYRDAIKFSNQMLIDLEFIKNVEKGKLAIELDDFILISILKQKYYRVFYELAKSPEKHIQDFENKWKEKFFLIPDHKGSIYEFKFISIIDRWEYYDDYQITEIEELLKELLGRTKYKRDFSLNNPNYFERYFDFNIGVSNSTIIDLIKDNKADNSSKETKIKGWYDSGFLEVVLNRVNNSLFTLNTDLKREETLKLIDFVFLVNKIFIKIKNDDKLTQSEDLFDAIRYFKSDAQNDISKLLFDKRHISESDLWNHITNEIFEGDSFFPNELEKYLFYQRIINL